MLAILIIIAATIRYDDNVNYDGHDIHFSLYRWVMIIDIRIDNDYNVDFIIIATMMIIWWRQWRWPGRLGRRDLKSPIACLF